MPKIICKGAQNKGFKGADAVVITGMQIGGKKMPKYFEEKELREWVQNWFEMNRYYHPYSKSNDIPIPELYDILEQMPTADVVERKKGKWIKQNPFVDTEECSLCKYNIYSEELETPFCPWCGAEMRGEE